MTELERVTSRVVGCVRSKAATVTASCGKTSGLRKSERKLSNRLMAIRGPELSNTPLGVQLV